MDKKVAELEQRLISLGIKRFGRSKWDGSYRQFTKGCKGCGAYKKLGDDELCLDGIAWKRLIRVDNPRKCQYH